MRIDHAAARDQGSGPLVDHRGAEDLPGAEALRVQRARIVMGIADVGTHMAAARGLAASATAFACLCGQGQRACAGQESKAEGQTVPCLRHGDSSHVRLLVGNTLFLTDSQNIIVIAQSLCADGHSRYV
jgi:hypothetical protein